MERFRKISKVVGKKLRGGTSEEEYKKLNEMLKDLNKDKGMGETKEKKKYYDRIKKERELLKRGKAREAAEHKRVDREGFLKGKRVTDRPQIKDRNEKELKIEEEKRKERYIKLEELKKKKEEREAKKKEGTFNEKDELQELKDELERMKLIDEYDTRDISNFVLGENEEFSNPELNSDRKLVNLENDIELKNENERKVRSRVKAKESEVKKANKQIGKKTAEEILESNYEIIKREEKKKIKDKKTYDKLEYIQDKNVQDMNSEQNYDLSKRIHYNEPLPTRIPREFLDVEKNFDSRIVPVYYINEAEEVKVPEIVRNKIERDARREADDELAEDEIKLNNLNIDLGLGTRDEYNIMLDRVLGNPSIDAKIARRILFGLADNKNTSRVISDLYREQVPIELIVDIIEDFNDYSRHGLSQIDAINQIRKDRDISRVGENENAGYKLKASKYGWGFYYEPIRKVRSLNLAERHQ